MTKKLTLAFLFSAIASASFADAITCMVRCSEAGLKTRICEQICSD